MLQELLEFLKPREETIKFGGHTLVVKELTDNVDKKAFVDGEDLQWKVRVRCVFKEDGSQLFTDADIPALKSSSSNKLVPIIAAVNRVNGFDEKEEVKNSSAAQS